MDNVMNENNSENMESQAVKKKLPKWVFAAIGGAVVVIAVILLIVLIPSKFEQVKNESVKIAGQVQSGKGYFTIDTYPDSYDNLDSTVRALLLASTQQNALKAIENANTKLGFSDSLYNEMVNTNALMGMQSAETGKYRVTWHYSPSTGLEVTYYTK